MSHWNYRIVKQLAGGEAVYGLHEVYYDGAGKVDGWTKEPATFHGDTAIEVADALAKAAGVLAYGVLDATDARNPRWLSPITEKPVEP